MKANTRILILVTVLIALILILLLLFLNSSAKQGEADTDGKNKGMQGSLVIDTSAASLDENENKDPLYRRSVELQGFEGMVLKKGQRIVLKNSPDNGDFYVKYCIENNETKEMLFETDLIPSGNYVEWTVSDYLDIGKYTLVFCQYPYWKNPDTDEFKPLTGGKNVVEIEVVE